MVMYCAVLSCGNNNPKVSKRTLPISNEKIYKIWVERMGLPALKHMDPQLAYKRYRVCDLHFSDDCRVPGSNKLKRRSVPTLNLPNYTEGSENENNMNICLNDYDSIKKEVDEEGSEHESDMNICPNNYDLIKKKGYEEESENESDMNICSNDYDPLRKEVKTEDLDDEENILVRYIMLDHTYASTFMSVWLEISTICTETSHFEVVNSASSKHNCFVEQLLMKEKIYAEAEVLISTS